MEKEMFNVVGVFTEGGEETLYVYNKPWKLCVNFLRLISAPVYKISIKKVQI